jgi:hypothetical protein
VTLRTLPQVVAIACIALLVAMPFHKGYHDISRLAAQHSGKQFWTVLAQYFLGNLAGGGKSSG